MFWAWASTWKQEEFLSWNIELFLPTIQCPSYIIQGEKDEFGTLNQVDSIVKGILSYSEKLVIPKVKHTPHKEAQELIIEKATGFIIQKIL